MSILGAPRFSKVLVPEARAGGRAVHIVLALFLLYFNMPSLFRECVRSTLTWQGKQVIYVGCQGAGSCGSCTSISIIIHRYGQHLDDSSHEGFHIQDLLSSIATNTDMLELASLLNQNLGKFIKRIDDPSDATKEG